MIKEGDLQFSFPKNWSVIKFDDTQFYRQKIIPTAGNLKSVDILAMPQQNKLLMIEVKDFRGYAAKNKHRITSGELVVEVIEKAMHTLSALYLAKYTNHSETINFVGQQLTPPAKIELVLFMEEDQIPDYNPKDTKAKLQKQNSQKRIEEMAISFRQKLKKTLNISSKVKNTANLEARDGFSVKLL
jgi:hypothetical protein